MAGGFFRHDFKTGLARSVVIPQKQREYAYVESCRLAVHEAALGSRLSFFVVSHPGRNPGGSGPVLAKRQKSVYNGKRANPIPGDVLET